MRPPLGQAEGAGARGLHRRDRRGILGPGAHQNRGPAQLLLSGPLISIPKGLSLPVPLADCTPIADAMLEYPLQAPPGQAYAYSNLGYCWLGRVLQTHTGLAHADAVRALVPELPTALTLDPRSVTVTHAVPSDRAGIAALKPRVIAPAGGWIGSASDYFRFAAFPPDPAVHTPPDFAEGIQYYGLGWRVWNLDGTRVLTHYGALPGAFSMVARAENGPLLVALFNGRPGNDLAAFEQLFAAIVSTRLFQENNPG